MAGVKDKDQASESRDLDAALKELEVADAFRERLVRRFAPFITLGPGAAVLDVGAAQGVMSAAYARGGFAAAGVEPWRPAIDVSGQLAARLGLELDIREGWAEQLPFDDESFDLVHVYSVMEHVDDPLQVFREAYRVLRPGGALFFLTTSVVSPMQNEIAGFPLFPWYPLPVKHAIMRWATEHRPALVGHTTRPAMHWFRRRATCLALSAIGFTRIVDKWELRARSGERSGPALLVTRVAAANRAVRLAGDLFVPNTEMLAIK